MMFLLPHIVEESAKKFPDKVAFECDAKSITYGELWIRMNQIANLLISKGIKKGDRVGVFLNRSLETAQAIYGIMQSGAAYVPLDPESPSSRSAFIINDCGINVVLSAPPMKRKLQNLLEQSVDLNCVIGCPSDKVASISWDEVFTEPNIQKQCKVLDTDLAYILYTSGSTGTPKGIMHSHRSGLGYASLSVSYYDITPEDVLGNHAAINFDISTLGYFAGPLAGASTVIVSDPYTKMPASLVNLISEKKITIWYSVPTALKQLLGINTLNTLDFSSLRWVLFAGEPFPTPQLRSLMEVWSHAKFSNIFGPTEVNGCSYYELDEPPKSDSPISIGKPWDNTEICIVDENDQPVEEGQAGELLVRTVTMMMGYWADKDKTEKSLFRKEIASGADGVFYRTGDMVKREKDGNLTFLGRKDRQVKIKGYRIELDEINTVLWKHPRIEEATVQLISDDSNESKIEAFIVLKKDWKAGDFKQYCEKYLPPYAIPEQFHMVEALPRNSRGKIDYTALKSTADTNF